MANDEKESHSFSNLIEKMSEEEAKEFLEFLDVGCKFKEWRIQARKYQDKLTQYKKEQRMMAILENQWEEINYYEMSREEYLSLGNSPLEVLRACVLGDLVTYPPPEILMVIANQFGYYMLRQGRVSLESAFYGDSRGRGIYAKRTPSKKKKVRMFERFHTYSKSIKGRDKSQEEILSELASFPEYPPSPFSENTRPNPFYELASETEDWIDAFLRDYRRWKKESS